jgi:Methylamine utilisation protein MauE
MNREPVPYDITQLAGLNWRSGENVVLKLLRFGIVILIGGILLVAAVGKLLDNRHFAVVLAQWQLFPSWSLLTLGVFASLSELALAIWLISGWRLSAAALTAVAFHLAYSVATVVTVLRGIRLSDCGCFGIFFPHPLDRTMVFEDSILAGICFVLYLMASRSKPENRI